MDEAPASTGEPLSVRVQRLESQVATLVSELRELKAKLGE
jgi:chaperonin cofactor prefoldin